MKVVCVPSKSSVEPFLTVIWPDVESIANAAMSAPPLMLYDNASPASGSLAVTGLPTLPLSPASSRTSRVMPDSNSGAWFTSGASRTALADGCAIRRSPFDSSFAVAASSVVPAATSG